MKYHKKPIIVEAEQWFPGKFIKGVKEFYSNDPYDSPYSHIHWGIVETLEGKMKVNVGDFIIIGIENEIYPCKKSIFEVTYEKVEE